MRPTSRISWPSPFQSTAYSIDTVARTTLISPAQALMFNRSGSRCITNTLFRFVCTVSFSEGMAASNQGNGFFIIHRHSSKGFTNVFGSSQWIRIPSRTFRINVNQTHLNRSQWFCQFAFAIMALISKKFLFCPPIYCFSFPIICTTTGKT